MLLVDTSSENGMNKEEEQDISQLYQIYPDDVLGSGQFGIVYGGMINTRIVVKVLFYAPFMGIMFSGLCLCLFIRPSVPLQIKGFGRGSF